MNGKNILLTGLLTTSLLSGCDFGEHKKSSTTSTPAKNNVVQKTGISALNIISDKPDDDAKEKARYSTVSKELLEASAKRNKLLETYPLLQQQVAYMPYSQLLPLIIKETKLRFISDGGDAFGYGQLELGARDHMKDMLRKSGVKESFSPKTDHIDNLVYMLLYFGYLKKEVITLFPNVKEEDIMLFTFACYNGGKNKIGFLHKIVGKPDNRDDFASKVVKKVMKHYDKPEFITDPTYGVPHYKDYFGDISDFQNDGTIIASGTFNGNVISVEKKKAYIIIRYVEIIKALSDFLAPSISR